MEDNRKDRFLIMIVLRDYQQEIINKIKDSNSLRNCIQAPTGAGKTIMFSYLANEFKGRVLILVNRKELLEQTEKTIESKPFLLTAGVKDILNTKVTIAMIETFNNRRKKGLIDINDYDLIIADEVQNLQFVKVFTDYKKRLLGFTATPITDKKEYFFKCKICNSKHTKQVNCCNKETQEYSKNVSLKKWYGDLKIGCTVQSLIDIDKLSPVRNFICNPPDIDKLKTDKSGQFTAESEDDVFNNNASLDNLVINYKEHCLGLKTMVFNSNINSNNNEGIGTWFLREKV